MRLGAVIGALAVSAIGAGVVQGQSVTVRPLGPIVARTKDSVGATIFVRPLSDGRVIVNDVSLRRLLLFDSTLTNITVIADSAGGSGAYGSRQAGLVPYKGDSTLFVDPTSSSFVVVDPNGKVARVMSAPRMQDVSFLTGPTSGYPAIDPKGRLVYRGIARNTAPFVIGANGAFTPPPPPDSAPILRVDLVTRKLDTATWIKIPKQRLNVLGLPTGGFSMTTVVDPTPITDEWALMPDGTIAVVKGKDYHVEFVNADKTRTVAPKLLFDWQRLTDDDKAMVIDSARKAAEATRAAALSPSGPTAASAAAAAALPPLAAFAPNELPDYRPPFKSGGVRVADDGNLWIMTTAPKPPAGGLMVDVINAKGELVDRIELPPGRMLVGVAHGIAYLTAKDPAGKGTYLERARLR
jgi:hypothetical protein